MRVKKKESLRKLISGYHTSILDHCFLENGNYSVVIDAARRFTVFSNQQSTSFLLSYWTVPYEPFCVAALPGSDLIVCGDSRAGIHFYRGDSIQNIKSSHYAMNIAGQSVSSVNDVLALRNNGASLQLAVGCDDGGVSICDIDTQTMIHKFDGHTEQVNKLADRAGGNEFLSCSNDGTVHLWDRRRGGGPVKTLHVGREIYALDVDDDFVVCGGSSLGLWHLSSESQLATLTVDASPSATSTETEQGSNAMLYYAVEMVNGQILASGADASASATGGTRLHRFNYSGSHLLALRLDGLAAVRVIASVQNEGVKPWTVVGGDSPVVHYLSEHGFLLHSINTAKALPHFDGGDDE